MLATALNDVGSEFVEKFKSTLQLLEGIQKYFEEFFAFQLPDELLIQLPREAISDYLSFKANIVGLRNATDLWILWAQTGEKNLLTARRIYSHWMTLKDLSSTAHKFCNILIAKGGISPKEADVLMADQKNKLIKFVKEIQVSEKLMEIFQNIFKKAGEKATSPDNIGKGNENIPNLLPSPKTQKPG